MIYDAIERIEQRRDEQHQTNMRRFEAMDSKLNKIIGAVILKLGDWLRSSRTTCQDDYSFCEAIAKEERLAHPGFALSSQQ